MSINIDKNELFETDKQLRPKSWQDYIGQEKTKKNVEILIKAALERGEQPEHILFYGPPGVGKTTLAYLIAKELNSNIKVISGVSIEKSGDLAAILMNLEKGDVLFIDEIHRLNKNAEEVLYPAMEEGKVDIVMGSGPSARIVQIDLEPFTVVSATTKLSKISAPLRSRFSGGLFHLDYYSNEELKKILKQNAAVLGIEANEEALEEIVKRSRFTPRFANYLLKRARDLAQVKKEKLTKEIALELFSMLGIDKNGLTDKDKELIRAIEFEFSGGPVGLKTLAAFLSEEESTIEEIYEPYLLQIGFLKRTPRGRETTQKAKEYLNL